MDVVICGAGIVGLVIANLLAKHMELQIAIVDPQIPQMQWDENFYDLRCSAIAPSSQLVLQDLGVWNEIIAHRAGVYTGMLVWDRELHNSIIFHASDVNHAHLGHIIENRVMSKVLYQALCRRQNVRIIQQQLQSLHTSEHNVVLGTTDQRLECKLLIAADGAKSWVRQHLNMLQYTREYQQSALVATVQTEYPHTNIAMQRFTSAGAVAFLPLTADNLCSIVWSDTKPKIAQLMQMQDAEFNAALAQEFSYKLGRVAVQGARANFPLHMQHAVEYVRHRAILLGDAAHVVHPLAGQGLNLGIADAAALYSTLKMTIRHDADLGTLKNLRSYERQRRAINTSMLLGVDGLQRLFANQTKTVTMLRKMGLSCFNNSNFIKNAIMRLASGVA